MKILMVPTLVLSMFLLCACNDASNTSTYLPTGKSIDVKTYKFGIHPYLNSKKMYSAYRPILDLIENKIGGIEIILETSVNYADYNKKLYRGDFDFSVPNPFQTYNALSHDYKVIARVKPDTVFRGIFIARKDSNLSSVAQLKGQKISFPAPTALAATMMPLMYLHKHGLDVKKDIKKMYVGSHYSSILNAYVSDTIVGTTWPPPWESWKKENPEKAKEMEVVWQTESLINIGVVVKKELDKELVQKVKDSLVGLDKTLRGQQLLHAAELEGFRDSNCSDYDIVSDFLQSYDKVIGTPE